MIIDIRNCRISERGLADVLHHRYLLGSEPSSLRLRAREWNRDRPRRLWGKVKACFLDEWRQSLRGGDRCCVSVRDE